MPTTIVKQGDLFPDVEYQVTDENNAPVNLIGATLTFAMRKARDPTIKPVDGAAGVLVDAALGKIAYRWAAGQTDVAGTYEGEYKITPQAGDAFRAPTSGYATVEIEAKVGA